MTHIIWCISNAVIYQSKRGQDGIKLSSGVTLLLNGSESFVKIDRDSKDSLSIPVIKCRLEIFRSLVTKLWFSFSTGTNPFGLPWKYLKIIVKVQKARRRYLMTTLMMIRGQEGGHSAVSVKPKGSVTTIVCKFTLTVEKCLSYQTS